MNVFTGNVEVVRKELEQLKNEIYHQNNLSSKYGIVSTLYSLNYMCNNLLEESGIDFNSFYRNKSYIEQYRIKENKISNKFMENFINNKDIHSLLCENLYPYDKELYYTDLDVYDSKNFKEYNENEIYEILVDFFSKNKDKIGLETFKRLIADKKIYKKEFDTSEFSGVTFFNTNTGSSHVLVDYSIDDIGMMISLVHEIGHVVDYDQIKIYHNKKLLDYYFSKSIFNETVSGFYEKKFMDFLIEENIAFSLSSSYLQSFYLDMFKEISYINLFCSLKNQLLKGYRYQNISKKQFYDEVLETPLSDDELKDYNEPGNLNLAELLKYGYGRVLGVYFSSLSRNDLDAYKEKYSRFLNIRCGYFPDNFLGLMDFDFSEVSKTIDDDILNSSAKIQIKK